MLVSAGSSALPLLAAAAGLAVFPGRVSVRRRLRRLWPAAGADRPRAVVRATADPLAAASTFDLLAACLRAGLPMAGAARAAAPSAPERLAQALRRAADLLALGADAGAAWERAAQEAAESEEVAALARMARRSARSGASMAVAIAELAEQHRTAVEDAAAARAERAGVLISGPLGLCFLPAFVCLGIVPVVIGLAGRVLGGGLL
ncbi:type II secretion system F family protein [Nocardia arthritidis]|uniref:Type II secretion system F family protein n=1 Tax=Nocardia arthritidis TaxID=228602 RepID=A0A6G9Y544_9NOCA|nr:type II secretion system F family protein [Nocardia arthritidis]QIS08322.1 type II secretion system F family protein [Nocardia arthritidis]